MAPAQGRPPHAGQLCPFKSCSKPRAPGYPTRSRPGPRHACFALAVAPRARKPPCGPRPGTAQNLALTRCALTPPPCTRPGVNPPAARSSQYRHPSLGLDRTTRKGGAQSSNVESPGWDLPVTSALGRTGSYHRSTTAAPLGLQLRTHGVSCTDGALCLAHSNGTRQPPPLPSYGRRCWVRLPPAAARGSHARDCPGSTPTQTKSGTRKRVQVAAGTVHQLAGIATKPWSPCSPSPNTLGA